MSIVGTLPPESSSDGDGTDSHPPMQLSVPSDQASLEEYIVGVRCRGVSADETQLACVESFIDMGFGTVHLRIRSAETFEEIASFELYEEGTTAFDAKHVQTDAFDAANEHLAQGGFIGLEQIPAERITIDGDRATVASSTGADVTMALPPLPTDQTHPASLASKVPACCSWVVSEVYRFGDGQHVGVLLMRGCRFWMVEDDSHDTQCVHPDYHPENAMPEVIGFVRAEAGGAAAIEATDP